MKKKKIKKYKRRKLNYINIFKIFILFVLVIIIVNLVKNITFNNKVYDDINGDNLTITLDKKYLKLNDKNLEYIKKSNVKVKINYKGNSYIVDNSELSKKTNIKINTYNKRIKEDGFGNSKAYFMDVSKIIKDNDKVSVTLPKYLYENKEIDIYGVKNNKYTKIESNIKINKTKISFNINTKYDSYAFVYVKLKDIKIDEKINLTKNQSIKLNIKYSPSKATNKDIKFKDINSKYISIEDNYIKAKKKGTTSFYVINKKEDISKKIKVNIKNKKYKVTKKDGISYVDGIIIVNKTYSLPKDYNPGKLQESTLNAFYEMQAAALTDNINLWVASGFRSYDTQKELYNSYVDDVGKKKADTFSARPGHSEHQTGLAMDLNIVDSSFEGTPEAKWIEENCYKYGFIIRYPKGKQNITGYKYEPWHIRYVGKSIAKKIYDSGLTMEEYYGLDSKY